MIIIKTSRALSKSLRVQLENRKLKDQEEKAAAAAAAAAAALILCLLALVRVFNFGSLVDTKDSVRAAIQRNFQKNAIRMRNISVWYNRFALLNYKVE